MQRRFGRLADIGLVEIEQHIGRHTISIVAAVSLWSKLTGKLMPDLGKVTL